MGLNQSIIRRRIQLFNQRLLKLTSRFMIFALELQVKFSHKMKHLHQIRVDPFSLLLFLEDVETIGTKLILLQNVNFAIFAENGITAFI